MQFWLRVLLTVAIVTAQVGLVYWVRRSPTARLRKLMYARGEEWSPALRQTAESIRENPATLRRFATVWTIAVASIGIVLLAAIWLN